MLKSQRRRVQCIVRPGDRLVLCTSVYPPTFRFFWARRLRLLGCDSMRPSPTKIHPKYPPCQDGESPKAAPPISGKNASHVRHSGGLIGCARLEGHSRFSRVFSRDKRETFLGSGQVFGQVYNDRDGGLTSTDSDCLRNLEYLNVQN